MRNVLRVSAALALTASAVPVSSGQAVLTAPCPSRPLSIYFASGESTASPQAEALLGRIRETASECRPDRIDLVAHIDADAEGGRALSLSLERVRLIAGELVDAGTPADRIRIAAMPTNGEALGAGLHQVDITFRKAEPVAAAQGGTTISGHVNGV